MSKTKYAQETVQRLEWKRSHLHWVFYPVLMIFGFMGFVNNFTYAAAGKRKCMQQDVLPANWYCADQVYLFGPEVEAMLASASFPGHCDELKRVSANEAVLEHRTMQAACNENWLHYWANRKKPNIDAGQSPEPPQEEDLEGDVVAGLAP